MLGVFTKKSIQNSNSSYSKTADFLEFNKRVKELIKNRRSIRSYKNSVPDFKIIHDILSCAFNSPCAGNIINYQVVLVENKDRILKIARACENQIWISEAPYVLAILSNEKALEYNYPKNFSKFSSLNTGAFINTIIDCSTLFGLGSCWVGAYENEELSSILKCDKDEIVGIVTIGHINEEPPKRLISISGRVNFENKGNVDRRNLDLSSY